MFIKNENISYRSRSKVTEKRKMKNKNQKLKKKNLGQTPSLSITTNTFLLRWTIISLMQKDLQGWC